MFTDVLYRYQAAERRARDAKSCVSGAQADEEAQRAAKSSVKHDVIDLTTESDSDVEVVEDANDVIIVDDDNPVAGSSKVAIPQSKRRAGATALPPASSSSSSPNQSGSSTRPTTSSRSPSTQTTTVPSSESEAAWTCSVCTLINQAYATQCAVCTSTLR